MRTILATAQHDGLIAANPCHIRGAGNSKRVHKIKPLTLPELEALVAAMPERLRLLVLLAAWCGLRFGELTELRRSDIDMKNGRIKIRRAVVHVDGEAIVGHQRVNLDADLAVPPHLIPILKTHIAEHAAFGRDGLLFPAAGEATWRRRACMAVHLLGPVPVGVSTPPGTPQEGPIYASTTYGTPGLYWLPRRAPHSPS